MHDDRRHLAFVLAALLAAAPAGPALAVEAKVLGPSQTVVVGGLPPSALASRPSWADPPVAVDGPVVWAVAVLSPAAQTWPERLAAGSRQAQQRLFAVAEQVAQARVASESAAVQAQELEGVRFRLENLVDKESFVKVETLERPDAVWMRFGYPVGEIQQALGFNLTGAATPSLSPRPAAPNKTLLSPKGRSPWDYVWEASWALGVVAVTYFVVGVAQAISH